MKAVYFIGDSHTDAVREALLKLPATEAVVVNLHGRRDPSSIAASLAFVDGFGRYFSMIGGNAHNALGLLRHSRSFDFILPGEPHLPLEDGAEILTAGYVASALQRMVMVDLEAMRALRARAPCTHIESPPPIGDDNHVREHLDPYFRDQPSPIIAARTLRYKLWRLNSMVIARFCADNDIGFQTAPTSTMDGGFLSRDFYAHNATHANEAYGDEILRQVAA